MNKLPDLHDELGQRPYDVPLRINLIEEYEALGFPDLAAGEAYRTILLLDEITDESGEFHENAIEAAKESFRLQQQQHSSSSPLEDHFEHLNLDDQAVIERAKEHWLTDVYSKIVRNLVRCGCLKSAHEYSSRAVKAFPSNKDLAEQQTQLLQQLAQSLGSQGELIKGSNLDLDEVPDRALVRRELYTWNHHEPDRFGHEAISLLKDQMNAVAPKLEVKVTELPVLMHSESAANNKSSEAPKSDLTIHQLGIFAKEDIAPGEVVLDEKSLLTAHRRLHDPFCDACGISLSANGPVDPGNFRNCPDCVDICFCSEECFDLAQESYHPAICSTDVEVSAANATATESSDVLYSLLLLRTLAMSETQDIHPLDLPEVKYIWGDYSNAPALETLAVNVPRNLPFSFKYNIFLPLHMLEKMDINIFETSSKYDFWVFNTLYAKFRGTASARQGLDGKPEIAAVHPLWCLANHSCDPNITWDWQGSIKFTARPERVLWKGKKEREQAGFKKGEELLSHYCDVELPVTERREWAVGALGGVCMCDRCRWEETQS